MQSISIIKIYQYQNNYKYFFYVYYFSVKCLCSNLAPKNDNKVDDSDCDIACVGGSSSTCGGDERIQIYDLMSK